MDHSPHAHEVASFIVADRQEWYSCQMRTYCFDPDPTDDDPLLIEDERSVRRGLIHWHVRRVLTVRQINHRNRSSTSLPHSGDISGANTGANAARFRGPWSPPRPSTPANFTNRMPDSPDAEETADMEGDEGNDDGGATEAGGEGGEGVEPHEGGEDGEGGQENDGIPRLDEDGDPAEANGDDDARTIMPGRWYTDIRYDEDELSSISEGSPSSGGGSFSDEDEDSDEDGVGETTPRMGRMMLEE
jgi:hypothetical protein